MTLKGTRTAENLLKSFAGESQARMRYTYYSSLAKKEGYVEIANILMEIAEQEKEHAKRFYKFLKEDFKDEGIEITSTYPVSYHDNTLDNLKADLVYTYSKYGRGFKVYPYSELNNVILPDYREYYEKYKGVVMSKCNNIEFVQLKEG